MNVWASTGGGELVVKTDGTITTTGTISSSDLTLETTGNNANILLNSNISASSTGNIIADGSGDISQLNGQVLSGGLMNLSSGSGEIGSSGNALDTAVTTLSVNTSGNVYVNESDALSVEDSTGERFELTAGGNIT